MNIYSKQRFAKDKKVNKLERLSLAKVCKNFHIHTPLALALVAKRPNKLERFFIAKVSKG